MNIAEYIIDYYRHLRPYEALGDGVEYLDPFTDEEVMKTVEWFYRRYYSGDEPRTLILGINPGRFGAGITGIPFTDPIKLQEVCGYENTYEKRAELSSDFVYQLIETYGGCERFYGDFIISSVSPLGYVKGGKNFNYYDSRAVFERLAPHLRKHILWHFQTSISDNIVINWGKGKNKKFLGKLMEEKPYKKLLHLPHPRWVMQYRRKSVDEWIDRFIVDMGEVHSLNLEAYKTA